MLKYLIFLLALSWVNSTVIIEQKPKKPKCGSNEHFLYDTNKCQITCENKDIEHLMGACAPTNACFCDGDYVRDKDGVCICRDECPKKNKTVVCKDPNEVKTDCYTVCADKTCKDRIKGNDRVCHTACIETGCICKEGYYRHDNGTCVTAWECSPPRCDSDETYLECGSSCPDTCGNRGNTCRICTLQCVNGCFCKEGTVRAANGSCIPPSSCPEPVCDGQNEKFEWCPPNCPHQNCSAIWSRIDCTGASDCCEPRCRCIDGYYRNSKGICVSTEECINGNECGPHASFNRCGTACPLTCDEPIQRPCNKKCSPGCQCDDGYVKDKDGNCIKPNDCPNPVCKEGEEYTDCGSACPATCDNRGDTCTACIALCVKGCFCKKGLVRAANGSCIPPESCPEPVCNGANEHFDWCPPNCPHQNCSALWSRIDCTNASDCCKPQCRCIDGYYRNEQGKCISSNECIHGSSCGLNSHYNDCGTNCPLTCEEPKPRACTRQCVAGCECDEGYVKDKDGNCIKLNQCPQSQCGVNETYVNCKFSCPTDYCKESNGPVPQCSPPYPCPPGCRCKPGYLKRREDGQCINKTDCPPPVICEEGEHYERCGTACPPRCDYMNPKVCTEQCVKGCFCNTGLIRDHLSGKCIHPEKCPATLSCGKNEHFEECGTACPQTCKNRNPQICTLQCVKGCFCDDGYVRDTSSGKCILPKECPAVVCKDPNEVKTDCYTVCADKTCKDRIKGSDRVCHTACIETGCICKEGYYRHDNGTCVSALECSPPRCDSDETYLECGSSCPDTCGNRGNTCRICTLQCVNGCFCKEGTVRAANGSCIAPSSCPEPVCDGQNEKFEWCPPNCPHQNCSAIWSRIDCTGASDCCEPRCRCIDGHYRNSKGICISTEECINGSECGPHASFNRCGTACPLTCDEPIPRPCNKKCSPGCQCDDGYIKDKDGNCIKPKDCPNPVCKEGEEYTDCGSACPATCDNRGDTCTACIALCVKGCFCKKGLVRAANGSCIPPESCPEPVCNGANEYFDWCPPNCPHQNCSALWSRIDCTNASDCCKPQCRCIDGYYRNDQGKCISSNECTQSQCGVNETYVQCKFSCPTDYCKESNGPDPQCLPPNPCPPGCRCKPGYLKRREDGQCIKKTDCPPPVICEEGEHYESCGTACPPRCDNMKPKVCSDQCVKGCFCDTGLIRDHLSGKCIPPEKCPATLSCGKNEHFEECGTACPPTCKNRNPQICTKQCVKGCFCDDGYVRDTSSGKCILPKKCPNPVCKEGEEYTDCGSACPATCDNRGDTCTACIALCVKGCFCKKGLVRAANGSCIPPESCPKPVCNGANEHFDWCPPNCPHQNCSALWSRIDCRNASKCCKPQCRCISGYYRNGLGKCISSNECIHGSSCGPNSHYNDCGTNCPLTCEEPKPRACTKQCVAGCECDDGYVKDKDGNCIKLDQCPQSQCGVNETYVQCKFGCSTDYCKESNAPDPLCLPQNPCPPGCRCKPGYLKRREDGQCIKKTDCPPPVICEEGEHYERCGTACPPRCDNMNPKVCTEQCVKGCFCNTGLIRDHLSGKCIPPKKCPATLSCGKNEHFEECGTACPPTCKNRSPQICTKQCVKGCFCDDGYVRDTSSGKCILPKKCPAVVCKDPNEVKTDCYTVCADKTCKDRIKGSDRVCHTACIETGCICKEGYYRHDNGTCVPAWKCSPPRCDSGENYLKCGSSCPDTCSNRGDTCRICTLKCVEGCFCKKGTVRAANGSCIPPSSCPKPVCKGPNEYFDWCPPNCPHQNCSAIWSRFDCTNTPDCCKPQCRCTDGHYRNNNGVCVSIDDCLCGDNAHYTKCGSACPLTCEEPNPRVCTLQCVKGCECDKGYVKNSDGQCVKPEECTNVCGENEVCNDVSIVCPPQTCDSIYTTYDCTDAEEGGPGCDCLPGYLRNGTIDDPCIPSDQCPTPHPLCPENEEWNYCGTKCPETCENKDKPIICLAICVAGCFCKNGFVKNYDGVCVPPSVCKPPVCPINEEWNTCGSACPPTCDTLNNPVACGAVCVEGCFCKKGLIRNRDGLCVLPDQCQTCPANEEWRTCGSACPTTCESLNSNKPVACPAVCVQGCFCKKGLIRNDKGICVPPEKCYPKTCPANEEWKSCGTACPKTCKNKDLAIACISVCKEGCFCKKGLVRNDKGVCIPPEKCPPKCKANEVYSNCSIVCPPQTCASVYSTYLCENNTKCTPGCNCIDGYLRNGTANDPCIPSDKCPPATPVCPENEVYNSCGTACPKTCKNKNAKIACIQVCKEGCFCRDNLVRNDDGVCVPPEECPHECPKNQEWNSCGTHCPKTCANKDKQIKCIAGCKAGCFCKKGLVLNDDGTCVEPKKCDKPVKECSEDEEWISCGTACPRTCKNKDKNVKCIDKCEVGCFCRKGLVRNDEGKCVDPKKCEKPVVLCPENEEWNSCGTACPKTCKNKDIKINCIAVCKEGCFCKKGLVRNDAGVCISPKKCPVKPKPEYNNPKQVGPHIFE